MNDILFFADYNPREASTWSNVPCCFVNALEEKGYQVRTFSTYPNRKWVLMYDKYIRLILDLILYPLTRKRTVYFGYSRIYQWIGERKIKKAVKKYPDANFCFFMNYLFYNKFNDIPSLLFGDWTVEMGLERKGVKPSVFQKRCIQKERETIENAEYTISIFPQCAEIMKKKYPKGNIYYLGGNFINDLSGLRLRCKDQCVMSKDDAVNNKNEQINLDSLHFTPYTLHSSNEIYIEDLIDKKEKSSKILFIGKPDRYKESAIKVIEAVKLLQKQKDLCDIELNIIGISKDQLPSVPDFVHCHGFLHKDNKQECNLYYNLLMESKVIVNPTPKWAAYSSTIEALYFCTPLIVSPYDDFVAEFGENITFGLYNHEFNKECIADNIKKVLTITNYKKMSMDAHNIVREYTWDIYVNKIINLIELD